VTEREAEVLLWIARDKSNRDCNPARRKPHAFEQRVFPTN